MIRWDYLMSNDIIAQFANSLQKWCQQWWLCFLQTDFESDNRIIFLLSSVCWHIATLWDYTAVQTLLQRVFERYSSETGTGSKGTVSWQIWLTRFKQVLRMILKKKKAQQSFFLAFCLFTLTGYRRELKRYNILINDKPADITNLILTFTT